MNNQDQSLSNEEEVEFAAGKKNPPVTAEPCGVNTNPRGDS